MALLTTQTQDKMDALKNKLEKNIEAFNAQVSHFHLKKEVREIAGQLTIAPNWNLDNVQ